MLLNRMAGWQPFRIDALGLVTIFGAEEMNTAVGTLTQSWVTDWLPFLGSYTVANNQIVKPIQGFVLYNITDGIVATDVCGWFTRWLVSYPITYSATTITLRTDGSPMSADRRAIALGLGVLSMLPLLILAVLIEDWWAVVNIVALIISVAIRQQVLGQLRNSIDQAANSVPRTAIVKTLLTDPRPVNREWYSDMRMIGWLAFGVHAISLGMSTLVNQICCVFILVLCSFLKCRQIGERIHTIGTKLRLETDLGDSSWTRSPAYIRLNLNDTEQDNMIHWNLLPQRSNEFWWNRYKERVAAARGQPNTGGSTTEATIASNTSTLPNPQHPVSQQSNSQGNTTQTQLMAQAPPVRSATPPPTGTP
ncbi:hypothetical protein F5B19DRAFT_461892 [Rostrohypoxylon terebratum]|nr:hypothetical protein F5B19DRAFT_461892 [Rostrohypoxylon terebratum]